MNEKEKEICKIMKNNFHDFNIYETLLIDAYFKRKTENESIVNKALAYDIKNRINKKTGIFLKGLRLGKKQDKIFFHLSYKGETHWICKERNKE